MYTLYIGSNNESGVLEVIKAIEIIEKYFEGFTWWTAKGMWKGTSENTLVVQIVIDDLVLVGQCIDELKKELKQDSIMVIDHNVKVSFV